MVRSARYAATYVALLAIMLHALVPVGWMPNPGAPGLPFTICTIDGFHQVIPQQPGDHAPAPTHDNSVCPFAATAHFAPPVAAPVLTPRLNETLVARFTTTSSPLFSTARDWNRAPRAPPANS